MIDFLTHFMEIFLYPISIMIDYDNPIYYGMIACLVTAGIAGLFKRLVNGCLF